jgi:hypothetical protein
MWPQGDSVLCEFGAVEGDLPSDAVVQVARYTDDTVIWVVDTAKWTNWRDAARAVAAAILELAAA